MSVVTIQPRNSRGRYIETPNLTRNVRVVQVVCFSEGPLLEVLLQNLVEVTQMFLQCSICATLCCAVGIQTIIPSKRMHPIIIIILKQFTRGDSPAAPYTLDPIS